MKTFAPEKASHECAAKKWFAATWAFPVRHPKGEQEVNEKCDAGEDGGNKV